MTDLIKNYQDSISRGEIEDDPVQRDILSHLQRLADELENAQNSWFSWGKKQSIKGVYIYGPVGVGKTYLIDLFYNTVQEKNKARFHFHHFMQQIDLKLRAFQGKKDPLKQLAKEIAMSIRLLCFDEFLVHDVACAMILAELFQGLQDYGVTLVISSNTQPDDLYRNGVQRQRFLPAIAFINQHCEVLKIFDHKDYRLGRQPLIDAYLYPLNLATQEKMDLQFKTIPGETECNGTILIQNREIPYLKRSQKSIWFAFDVLCNRPRSQLDYLELAELFDTVFLSDIPCLTRNSTLQTIMFIHFIDVMYDRGINTILSAAVPLDELYVEGEMSQTFIRTLSRLKEMQSVDYLQRHPRRQIEKML